MSGITEDPIELLVQMWPGQFHESVAATYMELLADVDPGLLLVAVLHFVKCSESSFRPTVGQIRRKIAEVACGFPTEDRAWSQAREFELWRDQQRITGGGAGPRPVVHRSVVNVVRAVGCGHQGAFMKAWREERARWTEATSATGGCEPPPALTAPQGAVKAVSGVTHAGELSAGLDGTLSGQSGDVR